MIVGEIKSLVTYLCMKALKTGKMTAEGTVTLIKLLYCTDIATEKMCLEIRRVG